MIVNNEITGFGYWKIPSGEGVMYIEGSPTEEQRLKNRIATAERRKVWQPSTEAIELFNTLKSNEGSNVVVQIWDEIMEMCPDEGVLPFRCELVRVFTESIKVDDREFIQLFIEFRNPENIENGNTGGSTNFESYHNPITGTYLMNCSGFASIEANG